MIHHDIGNINTVISIGLSVKAKLKYYQAKLKFKRIK